MDKCIKVTWTIPKTIVNLLKERQKLERNPSLSDEASKHLKVALYMSLTDVNTITQTVEVTQ